MTKLYQDKKSAGTKEAITNKNVSSFLKFNNQMLSNIWAGWFQATQVIGFKNNNHQKTGYHFSLAYKGAFTKNMDAMLLYRKISNQF